MIMKITRGGELNRPEPIVSDAVTYDTRAKRLLISCQPSVTDPLGSETEQV